MLTGHEDWVRCLAFREPNSASDPIVLASGSQDGTIRLWRVEPFTMNVPTPGATSQTDDLIDAFEISLCSVGEDEEGGRQISLKQHVISLKTDGGR